jgi:8-oxo-dGTP pyrophosphatase MutT (NUDIX family)
MAEQEGDSGRLPEWEILGSEDLHEYAMFRVRRDRVRIPRDGAEKGFDVAVSPPGVIVVAVTPDDEIVLVEQYRVPLRRVSLEMPAGVVDDGEEPTEAGVRELREETGFEGGDPILLGTISLNPSWQDQRVSVVLIGNAKRTAGKKLDEGEDTRVRVVSRAEVDRMVSGGELDFGVALAALALLDRRGAGTREPRGA